jgi:hypothetical protein
MVRNEVVPTGNGAALFDGTNDRCAGDAQQFKAPAYHYLSELNLVSPKPAYEQVLKGSAGATWNLARVPSLDLFAVDWAGPPQSRVSDRQQNAAALALCDFARLQGEYPATNCPARKYEAGNGTLHSLGVENVHAGFTGWGYVAGWNADGQSVEFRLPLTVGTHRLTFRYAAGAGEARRVLALNGRILLPDLRFPGTGSWEQYRTLAVSSSFPPGPSRVSLTYDSTLGSANGLNLDSLSVN